MERGGGGTNDYVVVAAAIWAFAVYVLFFLLPTLQRRERVKWRRGDL